MEKENAVKEIRESAGLTRIELCALYNIPYRTLQNWENGVRLPPEWLPLILQDALAQKFPEKFSKTH